MTIIFINILIGVMNSALSFHNHDADAAIGWACSAIGWIVTAKLYANR
jgi:hypothetical protein